MKQIIAIIRPEKLQDVKSALETAGFTSMTVSSVRGKGKKSLKLQGRGKNIEVDFIQKTQIMLVVKKEDADKVTQIIVTNAKTKRGPGDGKIFILPVEDVIRIRTEERGRDSGL